MLLRVRHCTCLILIDHLSFLYLCIITEEHSSGHNVGAQCMLVDLN